MRHTDLDCENFTSKNIGTFDTLNQYIYDPKEIPGEYPGKLFLKEMLNLTGMEVSLNSMPAGSEIPFFHKHNQSEELFICLKGHGEMQIDTQRFPISEGSVIRIAPDAERTWRNNSDKELQFIVVQAKVNSCDFELSSDGEGVNREVVW